MNKIQRPLTRETLVILMLGLGLSSLVTEKASAQTGTAQGTWTLEFYLLDGTFVDSEVIVVDKPVNNFVKTNNQSSLFLTLKSKTILRVDRQTDDFFYAKVQKLIQGGIQNVINREAVGSVDSTTDPVTVEGVWNAGDQVFEAFGYFIGTKE